MSRKSKSPLPLGFIEVACTGAAGFLEEPVATGGRGFAVPGPVDFPAALAGVLGCGAGEDMEVDLAADSVLVFFFMVGSFFLGGSTSGSGAGMEALGAGRIEVTSTSMSSSLASWSSLRPRFLSIPEGFEAEGLADMLSFFAMIFPIVAPPPGPDFLPFMSLFLGFVPPIVGFSSGSGTNSSSLSASPSSESIAFFLFSDFFATPAAARGLGAVATVGLED